MLVVTIVDNEVNNPLYPVYDGDDNVIIVPLENGRRIITLPFPKEVAAKLSVTEKGELL
jgi:hypothetical protein